MSTFNKFSSCLLTLSLMATTFPATVLAGNKNEILADKLLNNLKTKVNNSLTDAQKKPLLTGDNSRLLMQCLSDDFQFQDVQNDILIKWQNNWKQKKGYGIEGLTTNNFVSQTFMKCQ